MSTWGDFCLPSTPGLNYCLCTMTLSSCCDGRSNEGARDHMDMKGSRAVLPLGHPSFGADPDFPLPSLQPCTVSLNSTSASAQCRGD